jgi:hypothetical protein
MSTLINGRWVDQSPPPCQYSTEYPSSDEPAFLRGKADARWAREKVSICSSASSCSGNKVERGTGLEVIGRSGSYLNVRTPSGTTGYVPESKTSDLWLLAQKRKSVRAAGDAHGARRWFLVIKGRQVLHVFGAEYGPGVDDGQKQRQGDKRTPEGEYYLDYRNPNSSYHLSLLVSWPDPTSAESARASGMITRSQKDAIDRAWRQRSKPPQNTAMGGAIMVHGNGSGGRGEWTLGCIGLRNEDMDTLWAYPDVGNGTPIVITPP